MAQQKKSKAPKAAKEPKVKKPKMPRSYHEYVVVTNTSDGIVKIVMSGNRAECKRYMKRHQPSEMMRAS